MGRAGSPADPTSSSTWVFSHVCSAGWSWRSSPPLMRSEPYSSSASTPLSPMREPSPPIWRPCATANGWSTANAPSGGPKEVLRYLARYTHRVAISNRRLVALNDNGVTFKWKDYRIEGPERYKVMTLDTSEFIRRFLMHVLPQGFHRIRYYGLLTSQTRAKNIARARELLAVPLIPIDAIKAASATPEEPKQPQHPCPCCGGRMIIIETFLRGQQPKHRPTPVPPAIRIDTS